MNFICLQDFAAYLAFCGIVLHNAQLYETSLLENRRNQVQQLWPGIQKSGGFAIISTSSSVCDVVVIPWLLLIPGTECCMALIKLSWAALGGGWVRNGLPRGGR